MDRREQLTKLSILPVNKTVVFYSPIEGKDILVRTGTIGDGSCCYHGLLHAYSKDYVSKDQTGRQKLVSKLRASLSSRIDREKWEKMSGGLVAKIPFQENVNNFLSNFYQYIEKETPIQAKIFRKSVQSLVNTEQEKAIYKLITEMIPLDKFEKHILPKSYDNCIDIISCQKEVIRTTEKYYKKIFKNYRGQITKEQSKFYINKLIKIVKAIVEDAEKTAYKAYIANLKDTSVMVDTYTIGLISNRLNRDIYFLDAQTRMPYREGGGTDNLKQRKAIILLWTGGIHYEVVGRLLPGNRIQREFEANDPLIKCIHTYLCHPEKINKNYPNLIPYLPKKYRNIRKSPSHSPSHSPLLSPTPSPPPSPQSSVQNSSDEYEHSSFSEEDSDDYSSENNYNSSTEKSPLLSPLQSSYDKKNTRKHRRYHHKRL